MKTQAQIDREIADQIERDRIGKKKRDKRARSAPLPPLGAPRPMTARVIVFSRPSGYWYAWAIDPTTGKQFADATAHSRDSAVRALRGKFSMIGVEIKSIKNEDPYE